MRAFSNPLPAKPSAVRRPDGCSRANGTPPREPLGGCQWGGVHKGPIPMSIVARFYRKSAICYLVTGSQGTRVLLGRPSLCHFLYLHLSGWVTLLRSLSRPFQHFPLHFLSSLSLSTPFPDRHPLWSLTFTPTCAKMPVSHIGLTVSHLPTSCSFFLSALQPLGYRFIGQQGNQIGLGIDDADFFICQETPG
jgi:hypothetical protein